MKKLNFDAVNNLKTLDELLQRALDIPGEQEKRKLRTIILRQRIISAACIAAVAAVSLVQLFNLGGRQTTQIQILPTEKSTAQYTTVNESKAAEENADRYVTESTETNTDSSAQSVTQANGVFYSSVIEPTEKVEQQTEKPAEAVPNTEPATQPQIQSVVPDPTEPAAEPQTEAVTQTQTEPATVQACENSLPTVPPTTEPSAEYVDEIVRNFYVPDNWAMYCKITDLSGSVTYGDADLYSEQHLCSFIERKKLANTYSYSPKDKGIIPDRGCYLCVFYDSYGIVFSSEKVYLNN